MFYAKEKKLRIGNIKWFGLEKDNVLKCLKSFFKFFLYSEKKKPFRNLQVSQESLISIFYVQLCSYLLNTFLCNFSYIWNT